MDQQNTPTLRSGWYGKAIGAVSAMLWAPEDATLAALTLATAVGIGHGVDWLLAHHNPRTRIRFSRAHAGTDHLQAEQRFLCAALGRIAKSGGNVTPEHICATERVLNAWHLEPHERAQAIAWFNRGKADACTFSELAAQCRHLDDAGREQLFNAMCAMAVISGNRTAYGTLTVLCGMLGIRASAVPDAVEKQAIAQQKLNAAHTRLGTRPGNSAAEIKIAYRRKVAAAHPDRLPPNASPETRARADADMVALREAYELLMNI